ncbi:hypothetical protein [Saccharicrinis fermentans]|uniref:TonB C-terminal domain-containing protein n=1 Tax=Saccharicrinis fermentans DSM 9555 = JCM 21142 TaxID=869213 RepID=W7Y6R9_9BACT|nr:hypothetical protein [Saccharicrinis fermentans]GAF03353.1 hypothetical protein JCM21142_42021 [Saccharicrinis fermentans DSM 9555 = JCM 21142]
MSKSLILFAVFILGCIQYPKDEYVHVKGCVVKNDWVTAIRGYKKPRAFYEYSYNDSIHVGSIVMGKNDPYYNQGDSLLIRIKKSDSHKPVITKCFYNAPKQKKVVASSKALSNGQRSGKEKQIVTIDRSNKKSSYGVSYYLVDIKPLFEGATNPDTNDSLINEYIKAKCKGDNQEYIKGTAATITIDKEGSVSKVKFFNFENDKYNTYLKQILFEMPLWKSGVKDGGKVDVAYNIVLE